MQWCETNQLPLSRHASTSVTKTEGKESPEASLQNKWIASTIDRRVCDCAPLHHTICSELCAACSEIKVKTNRFKLSVELSLIFSICEADTRNQASCFVREGLAPVILKTTPNCIALRRLVLLLVLVTTVYKLVTPTGSSIVSVTLHKPGSFDPISILSLQGTRSFCVAFQCSSRAW